MVEVCGFWVKAPESCIERGSPAFCCQARKRSVFSWAVKRAGIDDTIGTEGILSKHVFVRGLLIGITMKGQIVLSPISAVYDFGAQWGV